MTLGVGCLKLFKGKMAGFLLAAVLPVSLFSWTIPLEESRLKVGYAVGKYIGITESYGEAGLFIPLSCPGTWRTFGEIKTYRFDDGKWGLSSGLGLRFVGNEDDIWGLNVYYDQRKRTSTHSFNRVGFGLEFLSSCWDLRLNTYCPIHPLHSYSHNKKYFTYEGTDYLASCRIEGRSEAGGADLEFGMPLFECDDFKGYAGLGGYYVGWTHQDRNYAGGMARLDLGWTEMFALRLRGSYDQHNKTHLQAIFSLELPFDWMNCFCESTYCRDPLLQEVYRNGVIFIDKCCNFEKNW